MVDQLLMFFPAIRAEFLERKELVVSADVGDDE